MDSVILFIQIIAAIVVTVSVAVSFLLFLPLRWPSPILWFVKLYSSALSPVLVMTGAMAMLVGLTTASVFLSAAGLYVFLAWSSHMVKVTRPPDDVSGFGEAFGKYWEDLIDPELKMHFLPARAILKLPAGPEARFQQNICFANVPETRRELMCDIWRPPSGVKASGLALIYLHGSAWYMLDKDCGTRPLFRYLARQGHVIMDVAYRLAPEADLMGMVHDAKRAVAWMKENASSFEVQPDRIVIGGGSAGAHLALLTAYTADNAQFVPPDLLGKDVSVSAVVSLYGPANLEDMYFHTNQHLTTRSTPDRPRQPAPKQMPEWLKRGMGREYYRLGFDKGFENAGAFAYLLGGHPDECPEAYVRFSPVTHVHALCPPTLLIHGEHDLMAPVRSTRVLYERLVEENIPAALHVLPQTDHAFDLILPQLSPSAHNALYDVERFLALQAGRVKREARMDMDEEVIQLH